MSELHVNGRTVVVAVSYVTRSRLRHIQAHEIHHCKGLDVHLSLTVALITIQVTVQFSSDSTLNLEEEHPGDHRPTTSLPLPPTLRENLRLDGYLE
ncbi:hypothetical protein TNCV_1521921 [Trichonephila clavipes]|nr:hypothetical protein TNCV_1521921 [Trichonephila clavipes]